MQDRISQSEAFLSRSTKKLEILNAEASRIQKELAQVSARIRDGERQLEALKAEAIAQPSPFTMQRDPHSGRDSSNASTDRTDGGWNPGGFAEETQDVRHIICRFSVIHECPQQVTVGVDDIRFDRPSRCSSQEPLRVEGGTRDAMYGLRGVRVGEASNPGPRTLFFRRRRHDPDGVSGIVVDPTSTMVDSVPETHLMTGDGSESGASSGFLNTFATVIATLEGRHPFSTIHQRTWERSTPVTTV